MIMVKKYDLGDVSKPLLTVMTADISAKFSLEGSGTMPLIALK